MGQPGPLAPNGVFFSFKFLQQPFTDVFSHLSCLNDLIHEVLKQLLLLLIAFAEPDGLAYLRWFLGNMAEKCELKYSNVVY